MRIISGRFKGHHLVSFQAGHIRPTTDRVKETIFNKLMGNIEDCRFLDLFSGTGSLGLEALSRGASHCTFVDDNKKSMAILAANIKKLKIQEVEYSILNRDVLAFLQKSAGEAFDVILIDPPFTKKMAHDVMEAVGKSSIFHSTTVISIESLKQETMEDRYGDLERYDMKDYGDKILSFFRVSSHK